MSHVSLSQSLIIYQNKSQHKIFQNKGLLLNTVVQLGPRSLPTHQIQSFVTTTCDFQFWKVQHSVWLFHLSCFDFKSLLLINHLVVSRNTLFTLPDIITSLNVKGCVTPNIIWLHVYGENNKLFLWRQVSPQEHSNPYTL